MISQNGWSAFTDWGQPGSAVAVVPGTNVLLKGGLRAGDVSTVLLSFAAWFNDNIETLVQSEGCWGIDIRDIRGSSTTSNHQSGTAMDLNAELHPLRSQPEDNFTLAQIAKIRGKLIGYAGVIRWGGDYHGRKDPMHFEINASASAVAAVARQIGHNPAPPPVNPTPAPAQTGGTVTPFPLRSGYYGIGGVTSGETVARIQRRLAGRGYAIGKIDGLVGPKFDAAVRLCQRRAPKSLHLAVDGKVGKNSWKWIKA